MKLGNLILTVMLGIIGYHVYTTLQQPTPPPAVQAVPTPLPVPPPPPPLTPAPVATAPRPVPSPTPSGSWMNSVSSTPYDQTGRKRNHWTRIY
jgi:hypothetical protein